MYSCLIINSLILYLSVTSSYIFHAIPPYHSSVDNISSIPILYHIYIPHAYIQISALVCRYLPCLHSWTKNWLDLRLQSVSWNFLHLSFILKTTPTPYKQGVTDNMHSFKSILQGVNPGFCSIYCIIAKISNYKWYAWDDMLLYHYKPKCSGIQPFCQFGNSHFIFIAVFSRSAQNFKRGNICYETFRKN